MTTHPSLGEKPPSAAQIRLSAAFAVVLAVLILVAAVLPAERGIDPTGIGRLLGLTRMGELKDRLEAEAIEATALRIGRRNPDGIAIEHRLSAIEARLDDLRPLIALATPPAARAAALAAAAAAAGPRRDETLLVLGPDEGAEVRLVMREGAQARFSWRAEGGRVNFESDGTGAGRRQGYAAGRGVENGEGVMVAAFDGRHGWFWRNRGDNEVTIVLRTEGAYASVTRPVP